MWQVDAQRNICWQLLRYRRDGYATLNPGIQAFGKRLKSREQVLVLQIASVPQQAAGLGLQSCELGGQNGAGGGGDRAQLSMKGKH